MNLTGKRILLGITGSIAAYKTIDLIRRLIDLGAEITVTMTRSAQTFITPLTLETVSRKKVFTDLTQEPLSHITLLENNDLFLIAPATANIIGKMASGIADDLMSTLLMASPIPVLMVPAMNNWMYENPILQRNKEILEEKGIEVLEPELGDLACGHKGIGRFPETEKIIKKVIEILKKKEDLRGETVLITAGPTREPIDPVRFVSNRSSGKMGYSLARVAWRRGAEVTLISGPTTLKPPFGVNYISVERTEEMMKKVISSFENATIGIMAAAVADWSPEVSPHKIKKNGGTLTLRMKENPDILKKMGDRKGKRILVGFAAETDNAVENGKKKLIEKNLDMVVVNDLRDEGAGFDVDTNKVTMIDRKGRVSELPLMSKIEVADRIIDKVIELKRSQNLS
ncbi:MAG: bifunctional phosphopantothenoylcysteine decarboxylase/phosphopantothenate--cysteine ligase CoaBC [Nitrospirae bacterium]|nr:bifunctional phosphopantothenoylcysteine decarboxylase/phosphopantothenate--cysteine ligase CoaBC [Nitrospirota bacterium]